MTRQAVSAEQLPLFDNGSDLARIASLEGPPPLAPSIPEATPPTTDVMLARLTNLQGLLRTFGAMNRGENFRARFSDSPVIVRTQFAPRYDDPNNAYEESLEGQAGLEKKGRDQVAGMLGTEMLIGAGLVTKEQADAISEATYRYYEDRFLGLSEPTKKARKSALGKADRRVKRLRQQQ